MKKQNETATLTYEISENEIVFRAGEFSFKVSKDEFLALIDVPSMQEYFRLQVKANVDFADLDTAEGYARVFRLLKKGLTLEQVSRVLDVSDESLRKFWSYALSRYPGNHEAEAEIQRQGRRLEKDYCKAVGQFQGDAGPQGSGTSIEEVFVDALAAHQMIFQVGSIDRAAEILKFDPADFRLWVAKNKGVLEVLG